MALKAFYGFRLHLRAGSCGILMDYQLAPADAAETEVIWDLAPRPLGAALGDRNYWSPRLAEEFERGGGLLLAPFKLARRDPDPGRSGRLLRVLRRIENAIGQLVER